MENALNSVAILAQVLESSSCVASTGWLKAPLFLGSLPSAMRWEQARAKELMKELQGMMGAQVGRWDRRQKQQTPTPGSRRDRAAKHMWVLQLCSSLCALLLQKKPRQRAGPPPRRRPPTQKQRPVDPCLSRQVSQGHPAGVPGISLQFMCPFLS